MPIGVLTNCAAVLAGGALGAGLGKLLPEDLKDNLPTLASASTRSSKCPV